jgi:predicted Fe-S protein YdhL (DUF1289 family)
MDRRKARRRQLGLSESRLEIPQWTTLPEETRREVIALLAALLRSDVLGAEEVDDE